MANPPSDRPPVSQLEAVGFVWEILISIAVPTVFFALLGRWMDHRTGFEPYFTVAGLISALAISALVVYKKAQRMAQRLKS